MQLNVKTGKDLLLAFAISVQIIWLGPLHVLGSNLEEFSVTASDLFLFGFFPFLVAFAVPALFLVLARRHDVRFVRPLLVAIAVCLYVQFYLFRSDYGVFDGSEVEWGQKSLLATLEVFAIVVVVFIATRWPTKFSNVGTMLLAVFVVGEIAIGGTNYVTSKPVGSASSDAVSSGYFESDEETLGKANQLSQQFNIIVIMVDTLQADFFTRFVETDPHLAADFDGFVHFPDSVGHFPYTALTMPALMTGLVHRAEDSIPEYYAKIVDQRIDRVLRNKGFEISAIMENDRVAYLDSRSRVDLDMARLFDTYLFRQVPHFLKPAIFNNHAFLFRSRFATTVPPSEPETDLAVLDALIDDSFVEGDAGLFKFIHLWGMHPPGVLTSACTVQPASPAVESVSGQGECIVRKVGAYFRKLKELGVYDKSLIFVVADTGSKYGFLGGEPDREQISGIPEFVMSSANPTIAMKGYGNHGVIIRSNAPLVLADVPATIFEDVHADVTAVDGLPINQVKPGQDRLRVFTYYKSPGEARLERLSQVRQLEIRGVVNEPNSWTERGDVLLEELKTTTMSRVDFGTAEAMKFQDLGWSVEKPEFGVSWIVAREANLVGKLPVKSGLRVRAKISNPHSNQRVEVLVDGISVAVWEIPEPKAWAEYSAEFGTLKVNHDGMNKVTFRVAQLGPVNPTDARSLSVCVDWILFE